MDDLDFFPAQFAIAHVVFLLPAGYGPEGVHVIAFSCLGLFPRFGAWHFELGPHSQVNLVLCLFYAREPVELSCGKVIAASTA